MIKNLKIKKEWSNFYRPCNGHPGCVINRDFYKGYAHDECYYDDETLGKQIRERCLGHTVSTGFGCAWREECSTLRVLLGALPVEDLNKALRQIIEREGFRVILKHMDDYSLIESEILFLVTRGKEGQSVHPAKVKDGLAAVEVAYQRKDVELLERMANGHSESVRIRYSDNGMSEFWYGGLEELGTSRKVRIRARVHLNELTKVSK